MKNLTDANVRAWRDQDATLFSKTSDTDQPFRLHNFQNTPQVFVANRKQPRLFGSRQFIRCEIAPALRKKSQRAIVHDKMFRKELLGRSKLLRKQSPESSPADL